MLPCCIQAHDFTLNIRKDRVTQQDKIIPAGFHHMLHPVWWFYGIKLFSVQCCITASTYYTGDLSCFYFESSVLANHRSQRFPVFRFLLADWPAAVMDGPPPPLGLRWRSSSCYGGLLSRCVQNNLKSVPGNSATYVFVQVKICPLWQREKK